MEVTLTRLPLRSRSLMSKLLWKLCKSLTHIFCDEQAGFNYLSAALMACFFAITTPTGIAIGIGISSSYNENSPRSLVVEGVFDAISAGILVYMSLVDLIAADFLSKKMRCNRRLQVYSYFSLLSGCFAMSALAIWT